MTKNVTGGILCRKVQLWNLVPLILKLAQQWWAHKNQEDRGAQKAIPYPDQTRFAEYKVVSKSLFGNWLTIRIQWAYNNDVWFNDTSPTFLLVFYCFSFPYFLRLNRLLFAGVRLVGASRAPRASLTRAQPSLNNYSAEYNLFHNFCDHRHKNRNLLILEVQGCWIIGRGRGGGLISSPPPLTIPSILPLSSLLALRYWLSFPETIKTDFLPKKRCEIVYFLFKHLFNSTKIQHHSWTPLYDNAIFSLFESRNEFRRVLIKSEANPPAPPSDGRHEYSRSFQPATKSWKNSLSTTCPLPHSPSRQPPSTTSTSPSNTLSTTSSTTSSPTISSSSPLGW